MVRLKTSFQTNKLSQSSKTQNYIFIPKLVHGSFIFCRKTIHHAPDIFDNLNKKHLRDVLLFVCVFMCVCERARESERETKRERERQRDSDRERERERERRRKRQREREETERDRDRQTERHINRDTERQERDIVR